MPDGAIADLLAKDAIRDVLHRYCRGIDRMDADLTLSCWQPGGTADYGRLYRGSAEGLVAWLWPVHAAMVAHVHRVSNILIELHDREAATETYVAVTLRVREPDGSLWDIDGRGRYLDRFEQQHGLWAIAHRQYVMDISDVRAVGDRDLSRHLSPAATPGTRKSGRRDRTDPSYELLCGRQDAR